MKAPYNYMVPNVRASNLSGNRLCITVNAPACSESPELKNLYISLTIACLDISLNTHGT